MREASDSEGPGSEEARRADAPLRRARDRSQADEWLLVLTAEGFRAVVHHREGAFVVDVPASEAPAAARVLEQYDAENAHAPRPAPLPGDAIGGLDVLAGAALSAAIVAFAAVTGPRDPSRIWFVQGAADSGAILGGELWRTLTALCLHADWGHALSNALFGALFVAAAAAGLGPGVALALAVAAGAGGNLANAVFHGPGHLSVGASTAVFGAVGLLGGRGVALRLRRGEGGMRAWVPIAAGLAILSMLGTGERADLSAHLFGFLTGGFLGIPASLAAPRAAGWPVQLLALGLAVAALAQAWRLALA